MMEELLSALIRLALQKRCTDIHFILQNGTLKIQMRTTEGMQPVNQDLWQAGLFEYIKFRANLDLTNPFVPQSGQFEWKQDDRILFCRFSVISNHKMETGVLRLLHTDIRMKIEELTDQEGMADYFYSLCRMRQGLLIFSGPTNSGKTTTIHALLHEIALQQRYKIVTLEDPIEIEDDSYLQIQINEAMGLGYERGIEELLRHDPDILFIGETRNAHTAKMVIRAALTGHLVFTTVHAKNALETIERLMDFGLERFDLRNTLTAVVAQRIYRIDRQRKQCLYEVLEQDELKYAIQNREYTTKHITLDQVLSHAVEQGRIQDQQALYDIRDLRK
ncbi:MAG: Flp pilus assembly complex ATPase component TadA [Erysipelotrichaceae bacterium]|nr:Flp pilus assembly complex ATPase component TadA [Erysipelotrichaceae bacterium]